MSVYDMSVLRGIREINAKTGAEHSANEYFAKLTAFAEAAPAIIAFTPESLQTDTDEVLSVLAKLQDILMEIRALHLAWRVERLTQTINNCHWNVAAVLLATAREQVSTLCKKLAAAETVPAPAADAELSAGEPSAVEPSIDNQPTTGDKPVILVIDNLTSVLNAVKAMLKSRYDVYGVATHEDALRFLNTSRPELFLIDMDMPDMDAFTLLSLINKLPEHSAAPVLFLTSGAGPEALERARTLGVREFIKKPVDLFKLISEIEKYIHKGSQ